MSELRNSVIVSKSNISNGSGCHSRFTITTGEALGTESPIVSGPEFYSKHIVPSCGRCLRHAAGLRVLVDFFCEADNQRASEMTLPSDWFVCDPCRISLCPECSVAIQSSHARSCVKTDERKRQSLAALERLSIRSTESWILAMHFIVDLIEQDKELTAALFENTEYEYFKHHARPDRPELAEACEWISTIIGTPVHPSFLKTVVDTFDQTNLYLEITNETMMEDLAGNPDMADHLKRAYDNVHFPTAFGGDTNLVPIPVVIGSGHYQTIAMLNHSCDPNVEWRSINGTAHIELVALRGISKGEELFISYIDQRLPQPERSEKLSTLYGFTCKCSRCIDEEGYSS